MLRTFLFQTGSIKRDIPVGVLGVEFKRFYSKLVRLKEIRPIALFIYQLHCFYSKLVRLKVPQIHDFAVIVGFYSKLVRLKVMTVIRLPNTSDSFYSKLVRLKGGIVVKSCVVMLGFYSKLVRLKVRNRTYSVKGNAVFLFQTGSIKRKPLC